ncbi:DUF192 domain-containing protein [Halomonas garicola]|uniref:DUF192 domain-containing protein n=1 Tax=Halomonas garicola TaxID=1690008 RepID=UPI002899C193|nr:DUF192 domain-containing protein [Halomonas garicola]
MTLTRRRLLGATLALPVAALLPASWLWAAEPSAPDRHTAVIHTAGGPQRLEVEIVDTPAQRARGLMGRRELGEEHGMLFVYGQTQPGSRGFWMYRTLIPLDIAFIDGDGRIVSLQTMPPCESADAARCPAYTPGSAYQAALEVNAGYFASRGIVEGDCVSAAPLSGQCRAE